MTLQFHPLAFGVMVIVAIGTVAYTLWNSRPQTHQHYRSHSHSTNALRTISGADEEYVNFFYL